MTTATNTYRFDEYARIGQSLVMHGRYSDRLYLVQLASEDAPTMARRLKALARRRRYTKICAKVPAGSAGEFMRGGFSVEARIERYFADGQDALFMARFCCRRRAADHRDAAHSKVLEAAMSKAGRPARECGGHFAVGACGPEDAEAMAQLYARSFGAYPYPIHQASYLRRMLLEGHGLYLGAWHGRQLAAVAGAEIDHANRNAEMTDFATSAAFRGRGLASLLLDRLEAAARQAGVRTFFTVARASVAGMNVPFARGGYRFGGRLVNNTHFADGFESMNVWHKPA